MSTNSEHSVMDVAQMIGASGQMTPFEVMIKHGFIDFKSVALTAFKKLMKCTFNMLTEMKIQIRAPKKFTNKVTALTHERPVRSFQLN